MLASFCLRGKYDRKGKERNATPAFTNNNNEDDEYDNTSSD